MKKICRAFNILFAGASSADQKKHSCVFMIAGLELKFESLKLSIHWLRVPSFFLSSDVRKNRRSFDRDNLLVVLSSNVKSILSWSALQACKDPFCSAIHQQKRRSFNNRECKVEVKTSKFKFSCLGVNVGGLFSLPWISCYFWAASSFQ